ncbi:MAG: hypothetical protein JNM62_00835 [Flavobacteriales bacterium]|nr:hypothetical protein [Flavobacteriales bacterium]
MSRRTWLTLLTVFVLSVLVRVPLVDRPLSAHHEYCTAFTLIALTNWWEDGFAAHHGVPSGGFVREGERMFPADRYDSNERARALYYFSHPPLAYDVPYALFSITGVAPNAAGLQCMNIFFHLIAAIAVFLAVRLAVGGDDERAALFAAVLYFFLPVTLWFHGNAYMSDMFVQVPWVWNLVLAMRILSRDGEPDRWTWFGFGVTLFLTLYTSWLGVFAAVAIVVAAGVRWWKDRSFPLSKIFVITVSAFTLAFTITAWRFLQVIDAQALITQFASRFAVRGSFGASQGILPLVRQILVNYRIGFLPVILLLLVLVIRARMVRGAYERIPSALPTFILLAGLPVVLDHALLLQYAAHDFAALKAAPLFCGLAGWLLIRLPLWWSRVALSLTCVVGVLYFYRTNPLPGHDAGRYEMERTVGHFIATNAAADEVVFGTGISAEPQVVWYARRNVIGIADQEAARNFLHERGLERGVVISDAEGVLNATHITR